MSRKRAHFPMLGWEVAGSRPERAETGQKQTFDDRMHIVDNPACTT
ncbi:hypothetical protein CBM2637_B110514 [Cupriavidus taiwanensis]|nr:hypothetical protein CBM2637_B110514 [Cupriavidus taiwanensis]